MVGTVVRTEQKLIEQNMGIKGTQFTSQFLHIRSDESCCILLFLHRTHSKDSQARIFSKRVLLSSGVAGSLQTLYLKCLCNIMEGRIVQVKINANI